jgi:hypothetical protein
MDADLYFYKAKRGDQICVVDDLFDRILLDEIYAIYIAEKDPYTKYIHLAITKMILTEADKFKLYPERDDDKLFLALTEIKVKDKGWLKLITGLMRNEEHTPQNTPAPGNSFSVR